MNNIKILLAEDDKNLGFVLRDFLQLKNYDITLCENGDLALNNFKTKNYDLCLLDVMMPIKDGFTLAKSIKELNKDIPIIFLTAKNQLEDKIIAFNLGADDYIVKPFSTEELILRINAVLKRVKQINEQNIFNIGKYIFNFEERLLICNNNTTKLTSKENSLLKLLYMNKHDFLNRDYALDNIWASNSYFSARSMDVYISKLRNYLKEDNHIEIINIHGKGYKLLIKAD